MLWSFCDITSLCNTHYRSYFSIFYTLEEGEAFIYPIRCDYSRDSLSIDDMKLNIVGTLDTFFGIGEANTIVIPSLVLVVSDYEVLRPLEKNDF